MIFVTGGTGFLGTYLIHYLIKKGEKVRALRRSQTVPELLQKISDKVDWVEGDVLDVLSLDQALEGVDTIYHCAAMVSFLPKDKDRMYQINVEGTANLINLSIEKEVKRFVHVSSIAAIGRSKGKTEVTENTVWENSSINSDYAISKQMAEREVWRGEAEGLSTVILNPSMIIGAGNWSNGSGRIFQRVWEGLKFYTTGATGYVDVRDVAKIAIKLKESNIQGERFIVNSENLSLKNYLTLISKELGKKPPSFKAGGNLLSFVWRLETFKSFFSKEEPMLTKQSAKMAGSTFTYSNQKLVEALNWEYIPVSKTVTETAVAFMQSVKNKKGSAMLPF